MYLSPESTTVVGGDGGGFCLCTWKREIKREITVVWCEGHLLHHDH